DGYGNRPDAEEDGHAESAAHEVVNGMQAGTLPPFIGIRIKPFNDELRARSMRTLDIFISTLLEESGGELPGNFVVTLPKITTPEQVAALADIFDLLEERTGLAAGSLKMETMIETTQSIINYEGHIQDSLVGGFYQGWDLHPAQLPTRYVAVYAFFLESLDAASERLRNFVGKAAKATLVGDVFDDAATGQGLLNYFLRAINCGA